MSTDRFTSGLGPAIPHLARGKGELTDLRSDMYEAMTRIAADLSRLLTVSILPAPDVSGGATSGIVGLQLLDSPGGDPFTQPIFLEFAVFDDEGLASPSATATFGVASAGEVMGGLGTPALKIKTDVNGLFQCTLNNPNDGTVWLASSPTFGSPAMDCQNKVAVVFS